eukprot:5469505-Alexandrium_andersonii.AAC.1
MSASLVGSEMCIRDSHALRCALFLGARFILTRASLAWLSLNGQGFAKPVSYTHLTLPTICSV